jgi:hypothetical protein
MPKQPLSLVFMRIPALIPVFIGNAGKRQKWP